MPVLVLVYGMRRAMEGTNPSAVWRLPVLLVIVPHFVEVVLVELPHETSEVAMLEVFR
jgi:hypothetical protein